jgi:hypothetical protein
MSRQALKPLTDPERISDMKTRALVVGCGLLLASLSPALADNITATVIDWNRANRTITLEDFSQFANLPKEVAVPDGLKASDRVSIDWDATEDGYATINSITVIDRDISRRLLPQPDKRS